MSEEHDLVASYALDALDDLEARRFERHLDGCAQCQSELAELGEATTFLADSSPVPVPPDLKRKVMAQIPHGTQRKNPAWYIAAVAAALALTFGGLWATSVSRLTYAEQVTAIYQAADALPTELVGSGGEGRFMYSPTLGRGVFASHDLDSAPEDSVYELWLIDDAGPHPAGLFEPGEAVIVDGIVTGKTIAVTIEPRGGSDLPTGPVLLSAQL